VGVLFPCELFRIPAFFRIRGCSITRNYKATPSLATVLKNNFAIAIIRLINSDWFIPGLTLLELEAATNLSQVKKNKRLSRARAMLCEYNQRLRYSLPQVKKI
jgi:hypothetical protein